MKKYSLTILTILSFVAVNVFAKDLVDEQFGFRINIPDDFQDFPQGKNRSAVLYSFLRRSPTGDKNINIFIARMNGTINQEPLPNDGLDALRQQLPQGSEANIIRRKWKGYTVEGIETIVPAERIKIITRAIQIPLQKEAIQIEVGAPQTADTDAETSKILDQLLASLQGESNWDSDSGRKLKTSQRIVSAGKGLFSLIVGIGVAILIAKIIMSIFRKKKDKPQ